MYIYSSSFSHDLLVDHCRLDNDDDDSIGGGDYEVIYYYYLIIFRFYFK